MAVQLHNPILPGFYPDPSICRVGSDYYLVTSSFSYFPGIPIFHRKDLAHWEQIGHVLDRPSQLEVAPFDMGRGIFAPTIRWHNGLFYVISTNASSKGNFIVTAENPAGPWSDPHWIEGAPGIDPSLFWDDDGTAYYTGASDFNTPQGPHPYIWMSEIDLDRFCLVGEIKLLWGGALADPAWTEGPHLYKKDGFYYLMAAEGGTEHFHSEIIARAEAVSGPYHSYRGNPILTQRHLGMTAPIANAGHGDLVQCPDGSWYMVFLASRPYGGYHKNMGRETFIAPVVWEEGWPVVSPGTGSIAFTYPGPDCEEVLYPALPDTDHFDQPSLSMVWNYLGTPEPDTVLLEDSFVKIKLYDKNIGYDMPGRTGFWDPVTPQPLGFLGRRQQHMSFCAAARLLFAPQEKQTAGLTILQHDYQQIRLELGRNEKGEMVLRALRCYHSLEVCLVHKPDRGSYKEEVLREIPWDGEEVILEITAKLQEYTLSARHSQEDAPVVLATLDGGFLGSETAGGFEGAYIGMFASGNGKTYDAFASFDWFTYRPLSE